MQVHPVGVQVRVIFIILQAPHVVAHAVLFAHADQVAELQTFWVDVLVEVHVVVVVGSAVVVVVFVVVVAANMYNQSRSFNSTRWIRWNKADNIGEYHIVECSRCIVSTRCTYKIGSRIQWIRFLIELIEWSGSIICPYGWCVVECPIITTHFCCLTPICIGTVSNRYDTIHCARNDGWQYDKCTAHRTG